MRYEKGADKDLDAAYELFTELTAVPEQDKDDPEMEQKQVKGYSFVIKHLQGILGVEKLTMLRDTILDTAFTQEQKGKFAN